MQKLQAYVSVIVFSTLVGTSAFAGVLQCDFKDERLPGIDSIEMTEEALVINGNVTIPVEETRIRCSNFGKRKRYDGQLEQDGLQVILKNCTTEAALEGHLIDPKAKKAVEVFCNEPEL